MNTLHDLFIKDDSPYVRHALATNPRLSYENMLILLEDQDWFVREGLANNLSLHLYGDILRILSNDLSTQVKTAVAYNPHTDSNTLHSMMLTSFAIRKENIKNGIEDTEINTLVAISLHRKTFKKDLEILATDSNQQVRRAVASICEGEKIRHR